MTTVAIYLRISRDPNELELGVRRQEEDCRALADHLGWTVGKVYPENDTSAFKRRTVTLANGKKVKRVVRPMFADMLDRLEAGTLDGFIVYDIDRFARDPRDLEDLIDIKESLNVEVRSVTGSLRLENDADITMARVMVAVANKSSRDTSRRVKSAADQRAKAGHFHGGRPPFGYSRTAGDKDLTPVPAQVALLNEAADRLLAGDTLYAIVDSWNLRGLTTREYTNAKGETRDGGLWRSKGLRTALLTRSVLGETSAGTVGWEPIMDAAKFERVTVLLTNEARNFNTAGEYVGKRSMGGGLAICGGTYRQPRKGKKTVRELGELEGQPCGKPLYSQVYKDQVRLVCHSQRSGGCGTITILHDPLEEYVFTRVIEALKKQERWITRLQQPKGTDKTAVAVLESARRDLDDRMARAYDGYVSGLVTKPLWLDQQAKITGERADIERRLADLYATDVLAGAADPATGDIDWRAWTSTRRRNFLRRLIDHVVIYPWPDGVATALTARREEPADELAGRRADHLAAVLRKRVRIVPL